MISDLIKKLYGDSHFEVARSYNNLALTSKALKLSGDPLIYYTKALNICYRNLGLKHRLTAVILHNIGFYYFDLEKFEEANKYFRLASKLNKIVYEKSHFEALNSDSPLAFPVYKLGNVVESYNILKDSIEQIKEIKGDSHIGLARSYHYLGIVEFGKDNCQSGICYFDKAIDITIKNKGKLGAREISLLKDAYKLALKRFPLVSYKYAKELFYVYKIESLRDQQFEELCEDIWQLTCPS